MGQPLQGRVIRRSAEHFSERHGAERRVVIYVAAHRARTANQLGGERVEREQVNSHSGSVREFGKHARHETPGGVQLLNFGGGFAARSSRPFGKSSGCAVLFCGGWGIGYAHT